MSNRRAVLAFHRQQRGARRQSVAVGPVTARLVERAAFAGMLYRQEQRAAVRRELAAADLTTRGTAGELAQQAAIRAGGRHHEAAVVRPAVIVGVAHDPQAALRVDAEIVGAMQARDLRAIPITRG